MQPADTSDRLKKVRFLAIALFALATVLLAPAIFHNSDDSIDIVDPPAPDSVNSYTPSSLRDGTTAIPAAQPVQQFVPGQLLVQFSEASSEDRRTAIVRQVGGSILHTYRQPAGLVLISLPEQWPVERAAVHLRALDDVEAVEVNVIYRTTKTPDDPGYSSLWALNRTIQHTGAVDADIGAPDAWSESVGNRSFVIGIVDSGVDYRHADLQKNIWSNPGEVIGNGKDDDGNGWIDDLHGVDAFNNDADPMDDDGHGTHIAGTIAAKGNNGIGGVGVMWNASLAVCKFVGPDGFGTLSDALICLYYFRNLKDQGINVVVTNNSWGSSQKSALLKNAIQEHADRDILFVTSAGNDGQNLEDNPQYPASYALDNVISVAASDRNGKLAGFSNFGNISVDIAAPGVNIVSTVPGDAWHSANGSSQAAAHVTGVIGLTLANDPLLTPGEAKTHVLATGAADSRLTGLVATGARLRAQLDPADSDMDGMPDNWEKIFGLDRFDPADAAHDLDGDGLDNLGEFNAGSDPTIHDSDVDGIDDADEVLVYGTDPTTPDTDADGLDDIDEIFTYGTDPLSADGDGDDISDIDELNVYGTNPLLADTDGDGLHDGWELDFGFDPTEGGEEGRDDDGDGLTTLEEFLNDTDPNDADTDNDGLSDGDELNLHGTQPTVDDSDSDHMHDGWEVRFGLDPLDPADALLDPDLDGFSNLSEFRAGTDPTNAVSVPPIPGWVTTQGNAARTAHAPMHTSKRDFETRWQIKVGDLQSDDTVIRSRRIIVTTVSDSGATVEALSLADGSRLWSQAYPEIFNLSMPALTSEHVATTTQSYGLGGSMRLLDEATGDRDGSVTVPQQFLGAKLVPYEDVLYHKEGNKLTAIDAVSKAVLWRTSLQSSAASPDSVPSVNDDLIVFLTTKALYLYDRATGALDLKHTDASCDSRPNPHVLLDQDDNAYLLQAGCLTKFDLQSRTVVWRKDGNFSFHVAPTMDGSRLYAATDQGLQAIDLQSGDTEWTWSKQSIASHNLVSTLRHVFVPTDDGIVAIDVQTGNKVWEYPESGSLAISDDGALIIFGPLRRITSINIDGDADGDGMRNWWERHHRLDYLDPTDAAADPDGDGLSNLEEYAASTNPNNDDSDGDGLSDGVELDVHGTAPGNADSDGDGLSDGDELSQTGTDPLLADTDDDGVNDGDEINLYGTSPLDVTDRPQLIAYLRESFESGLPAGWQRDPFTLPPWATSAGEATDGDHSLVSEPVADGLTSAIEWSAQFERGELAFDLRVDSASCCDEVKIFIDGDLVESIVERGWTRQAISIPQGPHTIRWEFSNGANFLDGGASIHLDNLEFTVPRPFASVDERILVVSDNKLWEFDYSGRRSRLPIAIPDASEARELLVTADHKIMIFDAPSLHIFDPESATFTRTVVGDWRPYGIVSSPMIVAGEHIYAGDIGPGSDALFPRVLRFDLNGNFVDNVMEGHLYVDFALSGDGDLLGLANDYQSIDRIDLDSHGITRTMAVAEATWGIAVGKGGKIYAVTRHNQLEIYGPDGGMIKSAASANNFSLQDLDIDSSGRLIYGSPQNKVGIASSNIEDSSFFELLPGERLGNPTYVAPVRRDGPDADADGMPDWWERAHRFNAHDAADAGLDSDGDGLINRREYRASTDPKHADTDHDGMNDGAEVKEFATNPLHHDSDGDLLTDAEEVSTWFTDPNSADSDGDGLSDGVEVRNTGSDPLNADSDNDGMDDGFEIANGLNVNDAADALADSDADALDNLGEYLAGTDLARADTDFDGLNDGLEVHSFLTNPLDVDSDDDRLDDGWEVQFGFDPRAATEATGDADADGYTNLTEFLSGSDPVAVDSRPTTGPRNTFQGGADHRGFAPWNLDPGTFREAWTFDVVRDESAALHQAVTDGPNVWVATNGFQGSTQRLVALDSAGGRQRWVHDFAKSRDLGAPAYANDSLYFQSDDDSGEFFRSIDADSGMVNYRKKISLAHQDIRAPTPFGGDLYAIWGRSNYLASYSGSESKINWKSDTNRSNISEWSPAVDDSSVYVLTLRALVVVDRLTGDIRYEIPLPPDVDADTQLKGAPILDPFGNVLVQTDGDLIYFDTASRSVTWYATDYWIRTAPAVSGTTIYAVDRGDVIALHLHSGSELWRWAPPSPITQPLLATVDHVFASSDFDTYALDVRTLSSPWSYHAAGEITLAANGMLYIAGNDGVLSAIRVFGDSDQDGMPDDWELANNLNPAVDDARDDADGDGISNLGEYQAGSDPQVAAPAPPPPPTPAPPKQNSGGGGGGTMAPGFLLLLAWISIAAAGRRTSTGRRRARSRQRTRAAAPRSGA